MSNLHLKSLKWCAPYTYDGMCLKAVWTRPLIKEDELNHYRGAQSTANVLHHQKKNKKKNHNTSIPCKVRCVWHAQLA